VQPLIRNIGSILVAGAKPADIIRHGERRRTDARARLNITSDIARDGFIGQISCSAA
jgi:hypothetical protein